MSTITATFTPVGSPAGSSSQTWTAPSTLLNGTIQFLVAGSIGAGAGSPGSGAGTGAGGNGSLVQGTVSASPGTTFVVQAGHDDGRGYHNAGAGGFGGEYYGVQGGGSSALLNGSLLLVEAAGGGGGGGDGGSGAVNIGGAGGIGGFGAAGNGGGPGRNVSYGGNPGGGGTGGVLGGAGGTAGSGGGSAGAASSGSTGGAGGAGLSSSSTGGGGGGGGGQVGGGGGGGGGANSGAGGGGGGESYIAVGVSNLSFVDGGWSNVGQVTITATVADPPLVSTLSTPAAGSYLDAAASGVPFAWAYKPGANSGAQQSYCLRIKAAGGAYNYWNAGSGALSSTPVWNASSAQSVTVPAGILSDGHNYNWSVATAESFYGLQGPFATDATFTATAMPTVTITSPPAATPSANPVFRWTETLGSGDSQIAWRVVAYPLAVTTGAGFLAGSTPTTIDSGPVISAALQWQVPLSTPLAQGSWVGYVQITETGGVASVWTPVAFAVSYDSPAPPTLTATPGYDPVTGAPTTTVVVTCHDNLLSADDASFELSQGSWTAGANTALSVVTTSAEDGNDSLLVALSSGSPAALSAQTAATYPVTGGTTYAAMASFRAVTAGHACTVAINWYTTAGTLVSSSTSSAATDTTTGWSVASLTAAAPSTAGFASVSVSVAGTASHYVDEVGLFTSAAVPAWTRGGLVGLETASVAYSDDGGVTWPAVRNGGALAVPANTEQATVVDYVTVPGLTRLYQATVSATVTNPIASTVSTVGPAAGATTVTNSWWLIDPLDPTQTIPLNVTAFPVTKHEQLTTHYPLGAQFPTVVADVVNGTDGSLTVETMSASEWTALEGALGSQRVKWLVSPFSEGWYVRCGAASPTMGISGQVHQTSLQPSPATSAYRTATVQYAQVAQP